MVFVIAHSSRVFFVVLAHATRPLRSQPIPSLTVIPILLWIILLISFLWPARRRRIRLKPQRFLIPMRLFQRRPVVQNLMISLTSSLTSLTSSPQSMRFLLLLLRSSRFLDLRYRPLVLSRLLRSRYNSVTAIPLLNNSWYAAEVSSRSVFATIIRTLLLFVLLLLLLLFVVVVVVSGTRSKSSSKSSSFVSSFLVVTTVARTGGDNSGTPISPSLSTSSLSYVLERFQFVLVERVVVVVRARARVSGRDESVRVDHFFLLFFLSIRSFSRRLSRVVICHGVCFEYSLHT